MRSVCYTDSGRPGDTDSAVHVVPAPHCALGSSGSSRLRQVVRYQNELQRGLRAKRALCFRDKISEMCNLKGGKNYSGSQFERLRFLVTCLHCFRPAVGCMQGSKDKDAPLLVSRK